MNDGVDIAPSVVMSTSHLDNDSLSRHHAELDERISVLQTTANTGDCHDLVIAWGHFEYELLRHFELEEQELLGTFALEHPNEVSALKQDHEALRRDLLALGIQADLHCLRAEAVGRFAADLRAHAAREDQLLYRWGHTHVEGDTWSKIARGLREARVSVPPRRTHDISRLGSG